MSSGFQKDADTYHCPVCLDILQQPVTLPCGHSYCMSCIEAYWDNRDEEKGYSCPQCRETFYPRPCLRRNILLTELVEKLRGTMKIQSDSPIPPPSCGSGDVNCDICSGKKLKAVRSCLVCMISLCETHMQSHYEVPALKKHKLVKATHMQQRMCSQHDRPLEMFCCTDQTCVCMRCAMTEHRSHHIVPPEEERREKQKQLGNTKRTFQQRIQERDNERQELERAMAIHTASAQDALEYSDRIFTELVQSIERRRSEVRELIRAQQKAAVTRAAEMLKELEQEIEELKRGEAELQYLAQEEDHVHFLQTFQTLQTSPVSRVSPKFTLSQNLSFEVLMEHISALKHKVEDVCRPDMLKISGEVSMIDIVLPPEPQTREEFLKYSCQLSLDPNTAHTSLTLSEGNSKAMNTGIVKQPYRVHPERFDGHPQVLCEQGLARRVYWETEWSTQTDYGVDIAVVYKSIPKKGQGTECRFGGGNQQSWCLNCTKNVCYFWHNREYTEIPAEPSSRIGVYVDHGAGTLSFYDVSANMSLLYKVQTTFTQPLYPGFGVEPGALVKINSK